MPRSNQSESSLASVRIVIEGSASSSWNSGASSLPAIVTAMEPSSSIRGSVRVTKVATSMPVSVSDGVRARSPAIPRRSASVARSNFGSRASVRPVYSESCAISGQVRCGE